MKISKIIKKFATVCFLGPIVPLLKVDNVDGEVKFANTVVTVNGEVTAKVTSFNTSVKVKEEDITGPEDAIPGTDVLHHKFTSISVEETASVEGISIETAVSGQDDGQSELKTAAKSGQIVTMTSTRNTGYGVSLQGYFTSYDEEGSVSGPYKFKGEFRVNTKTEITPSS